MSKQRRLILDVLRNSPGHLTAKEIYDAARESMPNISLGTVYRNLTSLAESGEIGVIFAEDGANIFDKTRSSHGHLICSSCGKLCDINGDFMDELSALTGEKVDSYQLTAFYLCDECRNKTENV